MTLEELASELIDRFHAEGDHERARLLELQVAAQREADARLTGGGGVKRRRLVLACQAVTAILAVTLVVTGALMWFAGVWGSVIAMPLNGAVSALVATVFEDAIAATWAEERGVRA